MGYSRFAELKDKDGDDYEIQFRDGYISIEIINSSFMALGKDEINEFLETLVAAAKASNIELVNVGYLK